jgi:hypothetical protein
MKDKQELREELPRRNLNGDMIDFFLRISQLPGITNLEYRISVYSRIARDMRDHLDRSIGYYQ